MFLVKTCVENKFLKEISLPENHGFFPPHFFLVVKEIRAYNFSFTYDDMSYPTRRLIVFINAFSVTNSYILVDVSFDERKKRKMRDA